MTEFDVITVRYKGTADIPHDNEKDHRVIEIDNTHPHHFACLLPLNDTDTYYAPGQNLGWVKAANLGMAMSTAPWIVLMNDDAEVVTEGWLEKLREPMLKSSRIACVGPVNEHQRLSDPSLDWEPFDPLKLTDPIRGKLSFFCVMFRREAWVDVGYLDERFGIGLAEDDDWLARAQQKKWIVALTAKVRVDHYAHSSWGSEMERKRLQRHNQELLADKWGTERL